MWNGVVIVASVLLMYLLNTYTWAELWLFGIYTGVTVIAIDLGNTLKELKKRNK